MRLRRTLEMKQLMNTGTRTLIEGNTWGDKFWGQVRDVHTAELRGENQLGIILMTVRQEMTATLHLQPTASSNEFSSAYVLKCDDEDDDVWVVPPGSIASYLTHSLAMEIGSVNLSHVSNE